MGKVPSASRVCTLKDKWGPAAIRWPPEAFLNVLCYVRSGLVNLESYETLHNMTLKNVSDGQLAVASPSVPLGRSFRPRFRLPYRLL